MLSVFTLSRAPQRSWISSSTLTKPTVLPSIGALTQYGAPLDGLSPRDFMDGSTFQVGQPPARVDILQRIDDLTFDEAWQNRIEGLIDGEVEINVISKDDLIRNKLASGREQDVLDVKKLSAGAEKDRA